VERFASLFHLTGKADNGSLTGQNLWILTRMTSADLYSMRGAIRAGATSARLYMESSLESAASAVNQHAFLSLDPAGARQAAGSASPTSPLAGLAVSVKDLFDIAGQTTAAGSTVLSSVPAASADCVAVARLKAAGGAVLGRTNMVEFAFSGVGWNPHFGTPANPADPAIARIPGGSSSGAAVSVASGAAFVGLGSDTGGSIRIPAALCGIVGFKNTARLVPTEGALPLSTTLDTVCALTRSVRDAVVAHEVLAARTVVRSDAPLSAYRMAMVSTTFQDGMDAASATAFERTLGALRTAGAQIDTLALDEINDLPAIQATGGFSAAESFAWHRELLARNRAGYDPRVAARIERGAGMSAADYIHLVQDRRVWIARMEQRLAGYDAVLSPTVPMVAPTIASIATDDSEFFRVNGLLLRNTSIINMLDGCAISLPCQRPGELPVGLMLWNVALRDDTILNIALQCEALLEKHARDS
jgi:Asp-tRNA(Asn)/Glu-tRNA(Gln) amidotransferase A subunit family amidase